MVIQFVFWEGVLTERQSGGLVDRCVTTAEMVQTEADKLGVPVKVEKVTDYAAIAGYGIASTPGIVIDGKVMHAGGLPKSEDLARWLAA